MIRQLIDALRSDRRDWALHPLATDGVCGAENPWWPDHWCRQRPGHRCPHNWYTPRDGCTSWDDHCPRCAEHSCECSEAWSDVCIPK